MHERTQRAVARLVFLFCCAVPTGTTLAIILTTWTPWYHERCLRALEASLSRDTGMVIQIEDFERNAPSLLRLHDVRVLEPETTREVARVRVITWVAREDRAAIRLSQPEIQSAELPSAWQLIHDRFLCRPEQTSVPIRMAADDLTLHSRSGPLTLRDVDAWIRPTVDGVDASIQCLPATSRSDTPVSIAVSRNRRADKPFTSWTLRTDHTALPCSTLAEYLPLMAGLGSEAEFKGTMRWDVRDDGWTIDLGGSRFQQVDLSKLFEKHPHRLTGIADLQLDRCRVEPGQTIDISGTFRSRDGFVGTSLIASVHEHLEFAVRQPDPQSRDLPYGRMAFGFDVFGSQLKVSGVCRTELGYEGLPSGVLLCASDGQPLVATTSQSLPAIRLARAFAPKHSVMVPISDQTTRLMDFLLAPSRTTADDALPPPPRITAASSWVGGNPIAQP